MGGVVELFTIPWPRARYGNAVALAGFGCWSSRNLGLPTGFHPHLLVLLCDNFRVSLAYFSPCHIKRDGSFRTQPSPELEIEARSRLALQLVRPETGKESTVQVRCT